MYLAPLILAFVCTLLLCIAGIVIGWVVAKVGITAFVLILFLTSAYFLLLTGEKAHDDK